MMRCKDAKIRERMQRSDGASGSNDFRVCKSWTQLYCGDRITISLAGAARFMSVSCGDGVKCEDDSLPLDAPFVERARRESASRARCARGTSSHVLTGHASRV